MRHRRSRTKSLRRTWAIPLAIALVTLVGLAAGLVGDGTWDAVSWLAIGIPVAVCIGFGWLRRGPTGSPPAARSGMISQLGGD